MADRNSSPPRGNSRGTDRPRSPRSPRDDRPKWEKPRTQAPRDQGRSEEPLEFNDGLGEVDVSTLPRDVRRDLETLAPHTRVRAERLLVVARQKLEDDEPEEAFELAKRAGKIAGRIALVREAVGVAAYRAGDFKTARLELTAARRMAGNNDLIPLLADCERALKRPEKAIELAMSPEAARLRGSVQAELILVTAGARADLGQHAAAASILKSAASQTNADAPWAARVYYGYAESLLDLDKVDEAREWFLRSANADINEETDASERLVELLDGDSTDNG